MEEYRVIRIGGYGGDVAGEMTTALNDVAAEGWTVAAASGAGDNQNYLWVVLRRAAQ